MIKLLKLVTQEDVIADVLDENEVTYELKNPARIVLTQQGVAMIPLAPFSKQGKSISVNVQHVVYEGEPEQELYNAYNERFGSGIVVAPANMKIITE